MLLRLHVPNLCHHCNWHIVSSWSPRLRHFIILGSLSLHCYACLHKFVGNLRTLQRQHPQVDILRQHNYGGYPINCLVHLHHLHFYLGLCWVRMLWANLDDDELSDFWFLCVLCEFSRNNLDGGRSCYWNSHELVLHSDPLLRMEGAGANYASALSTWRAPRRSPTRRPPWTSHRQQLLPTGQ